MARPGTFTANRQPQNRRSGQTPATRLKAAMPGLINGLLEKAAEGNVEAAAALIHYQQNGANQ